MDMTYSEPTARVKHDCTVCGKVIEPGTKYHRAVTFDCGDVLTWKAHIEPCQKATHYAYADGYYDQDGLIHEEAVIEWASENPQDEVAAALTALINEGATK